MWLKSFSRCFPAMIEAWRGEGKPRQYLSSFSTSTVARAKWAASRNIAAQRAAQVNATNLKNVGMVVTADRGELVAPSIRYIPR